VALLWLAGGAGTSMAAGAEAENCRVVRLADVGWTAETATTAVFAQILTDLGYQPVTTVLSVPVTFESMRNGDIDVFLGNWMPAQSLMLAPYAASGDVVKVRDNLLRPANAYVGEFVQHMNPLSVLNGRMVMRPWAELTAEGPGRWLDPGRQFSAVLDPQGRAVAAAFEGQALGIRASPSEGEGLIVADADTPLRQLIQWCRSGHPVLLAEGGVVQGVCGPTDVIRALATSDARARAVA
jgi:hypothetical protein